MRPAVSAASPRTADATNLAHGLRFRFPALRSNSGVPFPVSLPRNPISDRHERQQGLKHLGPDAVNRVQFLDTLERAMFFSPVHDPLGEDWANFGERVQFSHPCRVEVDFPAGRALHGGLPGGCRASAIAASCTRGARKWLAHPWDMDLLSIFNDKGQIEPVDVGIGCRTARRSDGVINAAPPLQTDDPWPAHGPGNVHHHQAAGRWLALGTAGIRRRFRTTLRSTANPVIRCPLAASGAHSTQRQDFGRTGSRLPPEPGSSGHGQSGEQRGDAQSNPPAEQRGRAIPAGGNRFIAGLVRLSVPLVLKAIRVRTVHQKAPGSRPQGGVEPFPRVPRLLTPCSSIPA